MPAPAPYQNKSKAAQQEFDHERLELLDLMLEAAHDGFCDWNARTSALYFSPRFKAIIGYEDEELPTSLTEWVQLTHPEDRAMIVCGIGELMAGDWPFDVVARLRHRAVGWRWLRCRAAARRDPRGNVTRVVATFGDVTDQIRAERRQASLLNAVPDLLMRVQSDSTVVDVKTPEGNVAYSHQVPQPGEKLKDSRFASGWADRAALAIAKSIEERRASQFEAQLRVGCTLTTHCTIEVRVFPSTEDESLFVIRDITAEKSQSEQTLQSQKLEAIGQLAAGIAHEINTPLQFVGDNLHFLADAANTLEQILGRYRASIPQELSAELRQVELELDVDYMTEHLHSAFSAALDGINRVSTIVHAMKSFSHPGGVEKRPEDLNHALETTITISTNVWKYVAEVERDFALDLPKVDCSLGSINQVFLNLITNAAHAIGTVVGDSGAKGQIRIATRQDSEMVEIRISDTGSGIPEAVRGRIFEPFFTTKPVGQGTGQGLPLARSIARQHLGTLEFETEEGKGTTFVLRLPIHSPSGATTESTSTS